MDDTTLERLRALVQEAAEAFRTDFRYAEAIARSASAYLAGEKPPSQRSHPVSSTRRPGAHFSREERAAGIERAVGMAAEGKTTAEIAEMVGCSARTIGDWLRAAERPSHTLDAVQRAMP
jgi:hypothetical protein